MADIRTDARQAGVCFACRRLPDVNAPINRSGAIWRDSNIDLREKTESTGSVAAVVPSLGEARLQLFLQLLLRHAPIQNLATRGHEKRRSHGDGGESERLPRGLCRQVRRRRGEASARPLDRFLVEHEYKATLS